MVAWRYSAPILMFLLVFVPVGVSGSPQTNTTSDSHSVSTPPDSSVALPASHRSTAIPSTTNSPTQIANSRDASQGLTDLPTQPGCYVEAYAGAAWQPTACGTAPDVPNIPSTGPTAGSSAQDVGNGNDEVASSASTLIGSTVGSFPAISGLTSEVGGTGPAFPGSVCLSGNGSPDCYSLQINTQTFSCSTTYTGGITTTCWEQFVSSNTGQLYIQFWLLGYCSSSGGSNCGTKTPSFSCPSATPPGGTTWSKSGGSCYANGPSVSPPSTAATSLGNLQLSGYANFMDSGQDVIKLCITGGSCYSVSLTDGVLNLYLNWRQSEFNVFGDTGGSQAVFNAGTTIKVSTALNDHTGNPISSSCAINGSTGETNNLFLGPCTASSSGITFIEASQAFALSATPFDATVLAGQTASYSVGLTLVQGTAAPVALSVVSGLPSGATATFTSSSVTPTGSSTLTISTPPSVILGDYTLTIQAQFGLLVKTTAVGLHLYDFAVGLSPADQTVLRGTTTSYSVTLTLEAGSSTTGVPAIGLSALGLPGDASSSFGFSSITPTSGGSSTTLSVTSSGAPTGSLGDLAFTVTGTDPSASGGSRASGPANLHVYDFSVSLSPSDATVLRGGSTAYTATLTLATGSATPPAISLSTSGLPSGSTSSFSSSSVTPTTGGATSTLTVNTYTGAPGPTALGDFTPAVIGTDNVDSSGGSRQGSTNLHIYDFSVTAIPSSLMILTTSSGTNAYSVSVTLAPGSTTTGLPTIALSVGGLPSGATAVFSTSSGTAAGFTSTLTVTTVMTPSGTYTLTITGTDARSPEGGARTASPTLVVLTPQQALQLVINQINGFKSGGVLNGGQANSLIVKLNAAISSLNSNAPKTACNQLGSFVNEVNGYVAGGILTPAQANQLLGGTLGVNAIMAAIPC